MSVSVHPSLRPSVCPSICQSICPWYVFSDEACLIKYAASIRLPHKGGLTINHRMRVPHKMRLPCKILLAMAVLEEGIASKYAISHNKRKHCDIRQCTGNY